MTTEDPKQQACVKYVNEVEYKHWCSLVKFASYDLSLSISTIRGASEWAVDEIKRLTQENADLKSKLERESTEELTKKNAELAILCVDSKCEIARLKCRVNTLLDARLNGGALGRDDLKKEVIE